MPAVIVLNTTRTEISCHFVSGEITLEGGISLNSRWICQCWVLSVCFVLFLITDKFIYINVSFVGYTISLIFFVLTSS